MVLNPLNSSSLEQLGLRGLTTVVQSLLVEFVPQQMEQVDFELNSAKWRLQGEARGPCP